MTFFGTLGLAFLMFLGLALCMMVTLVLAGLARLLSVIMLAMVGIFPKNDAGPVVRLPHGHADSGETLEPTAPAEAATADDDAASAVGDAEAASGAAAAAAPAGSAGRRIPWKKLFTPKEWPTPGQLRTRIAEGTAAAVENQAKHHPLLLAVTPEPPVLNAEWAAAVAEADAREEAREKAREEAREKAHLEPREEAPPGTRNGARTKSPEKSSAGSR
ncbi:hypothetical protein [Arthrobacter silvisoli]|uniref:hypothetical protein n=1 Tax=Arthrobacter silvisoli TaxID=2291022 RepID=UPI000E21552D|nr:hypothetical protein [Arthrobacter silvisoli]